MKLNSRQQEAVEHKEGPLLVVAGAGAGKTRVITHRIAKLIDSGVRPEQILAVTFTNKAAGEMRDRVFSLLSNDPLQKHEPFVSTFHALGVFILKQSGRPLGISRWFTILDRNDQLATLKRAMKAADVDPKQFEPKGILNTISRSKGNKVSISDFEEDAEGDFYQEIVLRCWREYEKDKDKQRALDFDDLLLKTVELLEQFDEVRERYQNTWHYIHIDEYQDTNKVQYELMKLLAGSKKNVFVVGDEDQMIYGWRGADYENIRRFEKEFATDGTTVPVVLLEENYRSTPQILSAANAIIKKNDKRKDKKLFTGLSNGEGIGVYEAFDGIDEARFVVDECKKKIQSGTSPEEMAVLYRANFQSRAIEEAFISEGVPYTILGTRFFERKEVKDILAYAKAALNPDDRTSVARVINTPRRGIGDKTVEKIFAGKAEELPKATKEKIALFNKLLSGYKEKLLTSTPSIALRHIIKSSGYEEMLISGGEEEHERLENIRELVTLATKYDKLPPGEGVEKLIEESSLASDQDVLAREESAKKGVRLMTVHAAKGLEFKTVFVVGLEQDLFPHTHMDEALSADKLEEERRLFYVALTRAKRKLYLSHASVRRVYGAQLINVPSEFLLDLPGELLETIEGPKRNLLDNQDYSYSQDPDDHKQSKKEKPTSGYLGDIADEPTIEY